MDAALKVLSSTQISQVTLVSKDVCHADNNVHGNLHLDPFLSRYNLAPFKKLHDLLMAKEGVHLLEDSPCLCNYIQVEPKVERPEMEDKFARWYSIEAPGSHVSISIGFK